CKSSFFIGTELCKLCNSICAKLIELGCCCCLQSLDLSGYFRDHMFTIGAQRLGVRLALHRDSSLMVGTLSFDLMRKLEAIPFKLQLESLTVERKKRRGLVTVNPKLLGCVRCAFGELRVVRFEFSGDAMLVCVQLVCE